MNQAQQSTVPSRVPSNDLESSGPSTAYPLSNSMLQELLKQTTSTHPTTGTVPTGAADDDLLDWLGVGMLPSGIDLDIADVDAVDSLESWLGLDGVEGTDSCSVPTPLPMESESSPVEAPKATDTPYCDQRDNRAAEAVPADSQCSATALTMSILAIYDNDVRRFHDAIRPLLEEEGAVADPSLQPEEAVIALMLATDWKAAFEAQPEYFEHNADWQSSHPDAEVIKNPMAQAYIASRFEGVADQGVTIASTHTTVEDGESTEKMSFAERWDWTLRAQESGGEVSFEGDFTGSGHVLKLVEMDSDRMVVHDPYGVHLGPRYLRNGEAPSAPLAGDEATTFAQRTVENSALRDQFATCLSDQQPFDRWGERNVFSRTELEALNALRWVLVVEPDADAAR